MRIREKRATLSSRDERARAERGTSSTGPGFKTSALSPQDPQERERETEDRRQKKGERERERERESERVV